MVTPRQKEMLDYLRTYIDGHGYAPTLEEVGRHFGLTSLATVHKHIQNLERKGLVRRLPHQSRALELSSTPESPRAVDIPLLGRVAAGTPIESYEAPATLSVPEDIIGRHDTFALKVRGESMVDEGILDGDTIIVESRDDAPNGTTVVALVRGDATVKRLYRERGRVRLQPANESMKPILAPERDVQIRGVVIALLRRYR